MKQNNLSWAFDIGIASVGWAVVDPVTYDILECGSNLFEAADADSNVERRGFRQLRRLHRRKKTRIEDYKKLWLNCIGPVPETLDNNQLDLRVKGLTQPLTNDELYAVLLNMLTHRGISYLDDALDDNSRGKSDYQKGISMNQEELKDKLPCQIQWERLQKYGAYRGDIPLTIDGESITLSNVFTTSSYKKELEVLFNTQKANSSLLTDEFISKYMLIFERKRKYYAGPGNELSRTDYGIYTTKKDENGGFITEKNLFDRLIGMCSVYPDEQRGAGASITAQEFNALNDLNNLVVNGRKLEPDEKERIIAAYKSESSVSVSSKKVRTIIAKTIGEEIVSLTGARTDAKKEEELFHNFEIYRAMRKALSEKGCSIDKIDSEQLDDIAWVLTINTDKEAIISGFDDKGLSLSEVQKEALLDFRLNNSKYFSKWQSLSIRIMKELIPEMYEQPKEQMTLLTEMGVFKSNIERYKGLTKIPTDELVDEMLNPVVRRSVRITTEIINALLKKYGAPGQIVIEMPRDRNSEEAKKRISDEESRDKKELNTIIDKIKKEYGINIANSDFRNHKSLKLKLKLWAEQDEICLYSNRHISIENLLNTPDLFEIDHIIPRSISFDDSRNNKVLVYSAENQNKGNKTPYHYLSNVSRSENFDTFKKRVIELKKKGNISKAKMENLLNTVDITKQSVLSGFINRNINDTRYASRVVLNTIQDFFKANNFDTKVKVVRGSFTHQLRTQLRLDKNRNDSYAHHAEDAALIAFSQFGLDIYMPMLFSTIDFETGEILDENKAAIILEDENYRKYAINLEKANQIQKQVLGVKNIIKYWYRVDRKANRTLCNQTIRGSREIDNVTYKINKVDIRTKEGITLFAKKKEANKLDDFLMKRVDPNSFEILLAIYDRYRDSANPFVQYEKETGEKIRRYSKKGNGPVVSCLKYIDGTVGSCIDISHKYGHEKGSKKVFLESLNPLRMDVYYNDAKKQYYLVGVKQSDCKYVGGELVLDMEKYINELIRENVIDKAEEFGAQDSCGYLMSFYKNDFIKYEKNGETKVERFLSRTMPNKSNYIETKPIDRPKFSKQNLVGLSKTVSIQKIVSDILGNRYVVSKETFSTKIE